MYICKHMCMYICVHICSETQSCSGPTKAQGELLEARALRELREGQRVGTQAVWAVSRDPELGRHGNSRLH